MDSMWALRKRGREPGLLLEEVREGAFPEEQHTYKMPAEELDAFTRSSRRR